MHFANKVSSFDTSNESIAIIIFIYNLIFWIGVDFTPSFYSGRCLFITLFLFSTLVYNFYTSILVSTLIRSMPENHINTLQDLAESKLDVAFNDIIQTRIFLNVKKWFSPPYISVAIMYKIFVIQIFTEK